MSKKSDDHDDDDKEDPKSTARQYGETRQAGTTPEQRSEKPKTTPSGNDPEPDGDPMAKPPDSPLNPNMPPDQPGQPDPLQRSNPTVSAEQRDQRANKADK